MATIIFVRHGQTSYNVEGRVQGGGALDSVGWAQAAALADRLAGEPLDAIYASPALRARQTARAVSRRRELPVNQRALLRDLDYGRFAGGLLSELEAAQPGLVAQWRERPHTVLFEGGEGLAQLRRRIERFVTVVAKQHADGLVLAATHDSPMRMVACLALGLDDSHHNQEGIRAPLASVTIVEANGDGSLGLRVHNDVAHLRGLDGRA